MAYIHPKTAAGVVYLNADKTKVVEEGPLAAFVLIGPGGTLSDEEAARYGLGVVAEEKAQPGKRPNKQAAGPSEDKAK